jgi:hypothetical protein
LIPQESLSKSGSNLSPIGQQRALMPSPDFAVKKAELVSKSDHVGEDLIVDVQDHLTQVRPLIQG